MNSVDTDKYSKYIASLRRVNYGLLLFGMLQVIVGTVFLTFLSFKFEYTVFTIRKSSILLLLIGVLTLGMFYMIKKRFKFITALYLILIVTLHVLVLALLYVGTVQLVNVLTDDSNNRNEIGKKMIQDLIYHREDRYELGNFY